jgi:hypothetical protein
MASPHDHVSLEQWYKLDALTQQRLQPPQLATRDSFAAVLGC